MQRDVRQRRSAKQELGRLRARSSSQNRLAFLRLDKGRGPVTHALLAEHAICTFRTGPPLQQILNACLNKSIAGRKAMSS